MTISPWRWSSISPYMPHPLPTVYATPDAKVWFSSNISPAKTWFTLSCFPSHWENLQIKLHQNIQHVHLLTDKLNIVQQAIRWDPVHNTLYCLTLNGWPKCINQVPGIAQHFWGAWNELSFKRAILLKGGHISVPPELFNRTYQTSTKPIKE